MLVVTDGAIEYIGTDLICRVGSITKCFPLYFLFFCFFFGRREEIFRIKLQKILIKKYVSQQRKDIGVSNCCEDLKV